VLAGGGPITHASAMFVVTEDEAEAILTLCYARFFAVNSQIDIATNIATHLSFTQGAFS
jgi:hypothetical protein